MKVLPLIGAAALAFFLINRRKKLELPLIIGGIIATFHRRCFRIGSDAGRLDNRHNGRRRACGQQ